LRTTHIGRSGTGCTVRFSIGVTDRIVVYVARRDGAGGKCGLARPGAGSFAAVPVTGCAAGAGSLGEGGGEEGEKREEDVFGDHFNGVRLLVKKNNDVNMGGIVQERSPCTSQRNAEKDEEAGDIPSRIVGREQY
jgi:hypothetical protein